MAAKSMQLERQMMEVRRGLDHAGEHVVVGVDVQPAGAVADPVRDAEPEHLDVEVDPAPYVGHEKVDVLHPARMVRGRSAEVLGLVWPPVGRRGVLDEVDDVALGIAQLECARAIARPVDARRQDAMCVQRRLGLAQRQIGGELVGGVIVARRLAALDQLEAVVLVGAAKQRGAGVERDGREAVQPRPALARLGGVARAQRDVMQPSHADHDPASPNVPWRSHTVFRSQ